jgi:hypothetical protein
VSDEAGSASRTSQSGSASTTAAAPVAPAGTTRAAASTTTAPRVVPEGRRRRRDEENIEPGRLPALSWADGDLVASLEAVYQWVVDEGIRASGWYLREKKSKARWSRALRILAILFATAGAAIPFVAANSDAIGFEWGYVLLACAAGAVAMDRFFGFSSAWMRYITAELAIQRQLQRLQFQWAEMHITRGDRVPSAHEVASELGRLAQAAAAIGEEVRLETLAWAEEFQTNIGELRNLAGRAEGPS